MIREFIGTGKTVEEATTAAKAGLNAPIMADLKFEVLQQPKKKILGLFGGADAQVKVSYDDGVKEKKSKKTDRKKNPNKAKQQNKKPNAAKNEPKTSVKKETKAKPNKAEAKPVKENAEEPKKEYPESVDLEYAKEYLYGITKGLLIDDVKIDASYVDGVIQMDVDCEDFGIIIGRRGDTLDSIQYLISLAMKKHTNAYVRVSINVGNYREKRNETLRHLAQKNASYVLRTKRRYTFEPMNPYERRIIHTAIQEIEGVESRSIGANQDRRVIIEPVGGAVRGSRDSYRRNSNRNASKTKAAPADYTPKSDRADLPKFGKIQINKD